MVPTPTICLGFDRVVYGVVCVEHHYPLHFVVVARRIVIAGRRSKILIMLDMQCCECIVGVVRSQGLSVFARNLGGHGSVPRLCAVCTRGGFSVSVWVARCSIEGPGAAYIWIRPGVSLTHRARIACQHHSGERV
jgi:hypothetical protein